MNEQHKQKMAEARKKNKPQTLFKCKNYTIEKIPLNYRITIKCEKKNQHQGIERDWYSQDDFGIDEAHNVAKYAISEFFKKDIMPVNPFKVSP